MEAVRTWLIRFQKTSKTIVRNLATGSYDILAKIDNSSEAKVYSNKLICFVGDIVRQGHSGYIKITVSRTLVKNRERNKQNWKRCCLLGKVWV